MPELPEVETIVKGLEKRILGKHIVAVDVLLPKTFWIDEVRATGPIDSRGIKAIIEGKKIDTITRRGKMIIISLSGDTVMLIHLKMTGQLIYIDRQHHRIAGGHPTADMLRELPTKSTRAALHMDDGSILYFNDQRQFGYIKLLPKTQLGNHKTYLSFGIEPLEIEFNEHYLYPIIKKRKSIRIKQILLDQSIIAGIGNIYADEALFLAGILPTTAANSLSISDVSKLVKTIKEVLRKGLKYGGTSSQHYVQANGSQGTMQNHLMVYRRTGQPCLVCGTPIERTVIGGRGTHYCPHCQK